jgi:hypothetical protein
MATRLDRMRQTELRTMKDRCRIATKIITRDAYGQPHNTYEYSPELPCGYALGKSTEIQQGTTTLRTPSQLRLPIIFEDFDVSQNLDSTKWIQLLSMDGVLFTPELMLQVDGDPKIDRTAILVSLKK